MLTIVLATIPYLGQLIDKHSIIVFFRWCSGPYPFIIMVSFLTSISSNDYARLRSRVIVIMQHLRV